MRQTYRVPSDWIDRPVRVAVIGAGGTGGEVLDGLARMDHALRAVGRPFGFDVDIYDPDTVSASNVGRQRFSPIDVGANKGAILAQRFNLFYGLCWRSHAETFDPEPNGCYSIDLLVTCVDKAAVRVQLGENSHTSYARTLWLDFGNGEHTGQVVFGDLGRGSFGADRLRLPNVYDLYQGELRAVDDTEEPSCSSEEAFRRQDFGVNRSVADVGLGILWNLLRHGETEHHGGFINVRTGAVAPLWVDPEGWAALGYTGETNS